MLFNEPRFLAFMIVVWVVAWTVTSNRTRKLFLLAASYFFYACWDWRFLGLILLLSSTSFIAAAEIARNDQRPMARRSWMLFGVGTGLGVLFFFKYFNFFISTLTSLINFSGQTTTSPLFQIILPVGISFFTFQSISYVLDSYLRTSAPTTSFLDYFLYVAFFPQLVAGPIVRATDFLPQLQQSPKWNAIRWRPALALFVAGYFKKTVLSDNIAPYVDALFNDPQAFHSADAILGTLLYAVQIYCDFSGYSDMGIAVAAFLGYRLCINFAHPYFALNISDFWRRWHISLSTWLRDYVYIPLGGNRHGERRTLINLMLTMLLGGIWHGAAWTFIVWGAMHGTALAGYHLWSRSMRRPFAQLPVLPAWLLTMTWIMLTWIVFRSSSLSEAASVLSTISGFGSASHSLPSILWVHILVAGGLHLLTYGDRYVSLIDAIPAPTFAVLLGFSAAVCLALVPNGYRPFIYFQF